MMETIIIGIIFLGAIAYLGKQLAGHFSKKVRDVPKDAAVLVEWMPIK